MINNKKLFFIFAAFTIFYLITIVADYNKNWMQGDVYYFRMPLTLKTGHNVNFKDLREIFNPAIQIEHRARFAALLIERINIKFRIWLWNYIPPHPSLSVVWIFSLILTPFFLFKFMYNITKNKFLSLCCACLFLLSSGFLSGITMLFLPSKPLTLFWAVFALFLTSEFIKNVRKNNYTLSSKAGVLFVFLWLTLFTSYNTDETAYFIFFILPFFMPEFFKNKKSLLGCAYIFSFIFFLIFVTFLVPRISSYLNYETFNYWGTISGRGPSTAAGESVFERLKFINTFKNFDGLISTHIIPFRIYTFSARFGIYLIWFGLFLYLFLKLTPKMKKLFLKFFLILLFFTFFHTAIMARHFLVTYDCYYYGNLFSLFFVISASILLFGHKKNLILPKILLCVLVLCFISNFNEINTRWKLNDTVLIDKVPNLKPDQVISHFNSGKIKEILNNYRPLAFSEVLLIWRSRYSNKNLEKLKSKFSNDAVWLFSELKHARKK